MDSRPFEEYPMMPTVTTYLSPNTYQSSSGQYHGSSPGPSSYSYPSSPQSASSVPGNFTLFSCSERALAKERRKQQNRASQRAYRKRKDSAVKGLHESIRELQEGADTLKVENGGLKDRNSQLQAELEKLLSENHQLKRKRSMSQYSSSKSSKSRRSSCTRCHDAILTGDRKGSLACSQCAPTDTSCISPRSPTDSGVNLTSPLIVTPHEDLHGKLEIDNDGSLLRSFWLEFDDELENNLNSSISAPGELQGFGFPTFEHPQDFMLAPAHRGSINQQVALANVNNVQQSRTSPAPFSEVVPSTGFHNFLAQTGPSNTLPPQSHQAEPTMLHVDTGCGAGRKLSNSSSPGARNKTSPRAQLL